MGLFDFVSNIGNNLFNKDDEASEKIQTYIEEQNPGINDLTVAYNDGAVTLSGQSDSYEAVEKAVLMAGNVKGVNVVLNEIAVDEAPTENVEYYLIKSGDTLSKIAKQYYGNAMDYPKIFEANREVIQDPDKIFVGQKIRIPLA
ncbi:MAG: peptidoglycan-binding protein LysM [Gammaproteobacteria bacterium]|nr:peptidoglycan-binding protein LysM [Gammaproteobacteria bacterium]